jgi:hypothetical protein
VGKFKLHLGRGIGRRRWGDREMGRWGDGEMGKWGDRDKFNLITPNSLETYFQLLIKDF